MDTSDLDVANGCLEKAEVTAGQVTHSLDVLEEKLNASLEGPALQDSLAVVHEAQHDNRETHQAVRASRIILKNWRAGLSGTVSAIVVVFLVFVPFNHKPNHVPASESTFDKEYKKGIEATNVKDYKKALTHYEVALKEQNSLVVMAEKAYAHYCLRQDKEVLKTCDKMIETSPSFGRAYYIKGLVFKRSNQKFKALEHFNLAAHNGDKLAAIQVRLIDRN